MNTFPSLFGDLPETYPPRNQWAEEAAHRAVVHEIRRRGVPGLIYFHVPDGGWRHPHAASRFKTLGARAGVSDLIGLLHGRFYALELKVDDGRMTTAQAQFQQQVARAGGAACAYGVADAIEVITRWGWLLEESKPRPEIPPELPL
jgi:hypothetical protein